MQHLLYVSGKAAFFNSVPFFVVGNIRFGELERASMGDQDLSSELVEVEPILLNRDASSIALSCLYV